MEDIADSGVKITVLLIINEDKFADKEYGTITIVEAKPPSAGGGKGEEKKYSLRNNSLILIKSRLAAY